jgi:hypothetical protein
MRMIALAVLVHMLRSRRFYERLTTVTIGVVAAGGIGRENEASTIARLAAWDKRQVERLERKAKAQGRAITGSRKMMRSGVAKGVAGLDMRASPPEDTQTITQG